jgi:uncharacterized protein
MKDIMATGGRKEKKMDELIKLLDDDATTNFSIIRTSHSKIQEFRKQLKMQAIKAAKDKGTYLTESIGEKLGEAITIYEPEENAYSDIAQSQFKMSNTIDNDKMYFSQTPVSAIDFRKIKLRFEVKMVFAIK